MRSAQEILVGKIVAGLDDEKTVWVRVGNDWYCAKEFNRGVQDLTMSITTEDSNLSGTKWRWEMTFEPSELKAVKVAVK